MGQEQQAGQQRRRISLQEDQAEHAGEYSKRQSAGKRERGQHRHTDRYAAHDHRHRAGTLSQPAPLGARFVPYARPREGREFWNGQKDRGEVRRVARRLRRVRPRAGDLLTVWLDRTGKTIFAVPRKVECLSAVQLGIRRLRQPVGVAGAPRRYDRDATEHQGQREHREVGHVPHVSIHRRELTEA